MIFGVFPVRFGNVCKPKDSHHLWLKEWFVWDFFLLINQKGKEKARKARIDAAEDQMCRRASSESSSKPPVVMVSVGPIWSMAHLPLEVVSLNHLLSDFPMVQFTPVLTRLALGLGRAWSVVNCGEWQLRSSCLKDPRGVCYIRCFAWRFLQGQADSRHHWELWACSKLQPATIIFWDIQELLPRFFKWTPPFVVVCSLHVGTWKKTTPNLDVKKWFQPWIIPSIHWMWYLLLTSPMLDGDPLVI